MMSKKSSFLFCLITLVIGCFLFIGFKNNNSSSNLIGAYVDGKYTSSIPSKNSGYVVEKIVCDNGNSGTWNYNAWGLLMIDFKKKGRCSVYFKKDEIVNLIKSNLDTTGKCPTVDNTLKTKLSGPEAENALICSIPDNYGTSYYYRGPVHNNYVYFAGFYWRIIRINGDNSIRIIYDGTIAHENEEKSEDKLIGYSAFNDKEDDNAYIGYMYGTPGSSTYEETHRNINSSTIKNYLDDWYIKNLENQSSFISDNIFCADRTINEYTTDKYINTKLGYGNNSTYYRWAFAVYVGESYGNNYNYLTCSNKNDSFSVNDSIYGNADLTYPIGLISKDEILLAGGWGFKNFENTNKLYFNTGFEYITMSPHWAGSVGSSTGNNGYIGTVSSENNVNCSNHVNTILGVKPVINLKAGSLKSGDGTINNPYTVG